MKLGGDLIRALQITLGFLTLTGGRVFESERNGVWVEES